MKRGMNAFVAGLVGGYVQGQRQQREQELHELQVAELRDRRSLAEELKKLDSDVTPTEGFAVTSDDSPPMFFPDEESANKAAADIAGAQVQKRFLVSGQTFDSKEAADEAAAEANAPAYKMRQRMELAMKYNQPQLAAQFGQAYKQMVDTNRQIAFDQFNQYRTAGNIDGILQMINSRPGSRGQTDIVRTQDGGFALQTTVNGQPYIGQSFASMDELLDGIGAQISATPDNFFERNIATKRLGLDMDKFEHQKDVDSQQLDISRGNLNLRQKEFDANRGSGFGHRFVTGLGPNNEMVVAPVHWTTGPGGPQAHVGAPQPLTGMQPIQAQDPLGIGNFKPGAQSGGPHTVWGGNVNGNVSRSIQEYNASKAPKPGPAATAPAVEGTTPAAAATGPSTTGGLADRAPGGLYRDSPPLQQFFPRNSGGR